MFATIFFGVQNLQTGMLYYVNGGHEPPLLQRASGVSEYLEPTGPLVGAFSGMEFHTGTAQINPGDVLLCYTDGITEARNSEGLFFHEERLPGLIQPDLSSSISNIISTLEEFTNNAPQSDDITMLALKWRK